MNPKLIGVGGPFEGAFFVLTPGQEVSMGRGAANLLAIDDEGVSERHCVIRSEGERFRIIDLESGQPTFVDGIPIRDRVLFHGDQIRIGRSIFIFLADNEAAATAGRTGDPVAFKTEETIEHSMVGESPGIRKVYRFIARVAPTDSTVLIHGESGTGKELAVRAMHQNSRRAAAPLVAINCAALSPMLLESELFGHEKGAFTGAFCQKKGKLEAADGGTVFLDEVGELDLALQAKLLRALQEREFDRVGGTAKVKVDVRLIAATNCDLGMAVEEGKFRRDLFHRLNVVSMRMPSLRERREDIPLLASYFIATDSTRSGREVLGLSVEARGLLMKYDWPGNVRELENAIQHAIVLGSTDLILPEDLPEAILDAGAEGEAGAGRYREGIREAKRMLILKAVEQAGGNLPEAAGFLGVHPNYLHRLIRTLNLRSSIRKAEGAAGAAYRADG